MGFIDNVSSAIDRGTNAAGRKTREIKLNSQMNDVNKRRQGFAAQLGASLYEVTKDNPALREGREELYDSIAACDEERARIQKELADIKAEAEADSAAAHSFSCAVCGARMTEADLFCSGCGTPAAQARPAQPAGAPTPAGAVCPSCGAAVGENDLFCMSCGAKIEAVESQAPAADAVVAGIPEPVGAPVAVEVPVPEPAVEPVPEPAAKQEPEPEPAPDPEPEPELVVEPVPVPEPEPEPAAPAAQPVCVSCGTPLKPGDKFCKNCGTRVE